MTNKNHRGQQVTDSGHVIKTSERYAADIQAVFQAQDYPTQDALYKALADYMMQSEHKDWSANVRMGVSIGRKEVLIAIQSAASLKELQKWADKELSDD